MIQTTDIITETHYPVMEAFYTLQGEGFHSGRAAYFIRLGGCDVGCVWCDVKESWDAAIHPQQTVAEILNSLQSAMAAKQGIAKPIVVITGGEPLMHNLTSLTIALKALDFYISIETSGSSTMSGQLDWVCLSPKKFKAPLPEVLPQAHELKVVIFHPSDFKWAETYAAHVGINCKLYLQPEWDKREKITPLIINYILQNPQWQLSLQTHKYIGIS